MESGIQGCGIRNPQTWNPESTAWNPESRTLLDYLTWGETYLYPDDLEEPSTLSHLISGRRLLSLPDTTRSGADNSSTLEIVTRRARYLQRLMDHLWNRWRREYIPALRESQRLKSDSGGQTVQIGDIVSVHDESLPRTNINVQYCRIHSIRQNNILFVVDRKIAFH